MKRIEYHMLKNTFTTKLTESKYILDVLKKLMKKLRKRMIIV